MKHERSNDDFENCFFEATRETVWDYLTNKDKLGEWYHPAEADLAEGQDYSLSSASDNGAKIWGRVVEMNAPAKLVTTFCIPPFEDRETIITWTLESVAGGTRISMTHEGIAEAAGGASLSLLKSLDKGWDCHFGDLRSLS